MSFLISRIFSMDKSRFREAVRRVSHEAGKPRWLAAADILWCGVAHGAGYSDYLLFEFWKKNGALRRTYLTRGRNNRIVKRLNDKQFCDIFDQKPEFNKRFERFIGRRWCLPESAEELRAFGTQERRFAAKPQDGSHGDGVELYDASKITDWDGVYADIAGRLVEAAIVQHDDMNRLCPASVNTVRIVTVAADTNRPAIAAAYLRVGGGTRPVDNFNGGGMVTVADTANGVVLYPAYAKDGTVFEAHPVTGVVFRGFKLPMWEQAVQLALDAARIVPQVRYVGWDVAFTPTGPVLVEGNHYPGHDIYGLPAHSPDGRGVYPQFKAALCRK